LKFACDRCGKRYASVDEPAVGRVYRIRCRCGHVIVVRGPASAPRGGVDDAQLRRFESPALPPPLELPARDAPPTADDPRRAQDESAARIETSDAVAGAHPPVPGTAPPPVPRAEREPVIEDDPFLRAVSRPAPLAREDERFGVRLSAERGQTSAAMEPGAAALPAGAAPPSLSLALEEDGAVAARRRVLLAAIVALLAAVAALAVSTL
jgi:DNA-directed RNA polymerase subunit RPC12/RpoP